MGAEHQRSGLVSSAAYRLATDTESEAQRTEIEPRPGRKGADLRIRRSIPALYQLHHRDLGDREITRHEGIPIVTPARAIADGIQAHFGAHLVKQATTAARQRGAITRVEEARLKRLARPEIGGWRASPLGVKSRPRGRSARAAAQRSAPHQPTPSSPHSNNSEGPHPLGRLRPQPKGGQFSSGGGGSVFTRRRQRLDAVQIAADVGNLGTLVAAARCTQRAGQPSRPHEPEIVFGTAGRRPRARQRGRCRQQDRASRWRNCSTRRSSVLRSRVVAGQLDPCVP